jgi:hypothetical protein
VFRVLKPSKYLLLLALFLASGVFTEAQILLSEQARFEKEKLPGSDVKLDRLSSGIPVRDYREKPPKPPEEIKPLDSKEPNYEIKEKEKKLPVWKLDWFRNVMIGLALALVLLILWKVFGSTIRLKSGYKDARDWSDETTGNEVRADADYDALALGAEQDGDYRKALRYRFLGLLQSLHANNWIQLAKDKTNRTYLIEAANIKGHSDITALTRAFERAWYGNHVPSANDYRTNKQRFVQVIQQMERRNF